MNETLTIDLLVRQLQQGSEAAFTSLYQQYSRIIYRKILRMTRDTQQAEELLQDVFLKVWERREKTDPAKSFKAFLFTIAINVVHDHFRKVVRDKELEDRLVALAMMETEAEDNVEISPEGLKILTEVLDRLPPQRKQIFMLCKLDGKTYQEVGETLKISPATVRDHMVKANKTIRKFMDDRPELAYLALVSIAFLI